MYFVIETKGSTEELQLRLSENLKIKYGKKHFEALDDDVLFEKSTANWNDIKQKI